MDLILDALWFIWLPIDALLGLGSTGHALAGTGWSFGATVADFLTWLIDFGGRVAELFS